MTIKVKGANPHFTPGNMKSTRLPFVTIFLLARSSIEWVECGCEGRALSLWENIDIVRHIFFTLYLNILSLRLGPKRALKIKY